MKLTRGWSKRRLALLGAIAVLTIAGYAVCLFDSALLLRLMPATHAIFLANWLMPLSAVLAAVAWRSMAIPTWRRSIMSVGVILIAGIITVRPLIANKPVVRERWKQGICIQTTWATCTAAAATTLLKLNGIDSSEAEMSALSLTTRRGTLFHGAYRGLRLKTAEHPVRVQVVTGAIDDLRAVRRPVLVRVGIRRWQSVDRRYETEWGWSPGVTHSVVLTEFTADGKVKVADPSTGWETWDMEMLKTLWHGIGLTIVPVSP
jgi:hypothetical protein